MGDLLLVLDVDGTLAAKSLSRASTDIEDWRRAASEAKPISQAGPALELVRSYSTAIVTVRSEAMRAATREWIDRYYPTLRASPLLMRRFDEESELDWDVKRARIAEIRNGRRIVLVDDQPYEDLLEPGDHFVFAPSGWHTVPTVVLEHAHCPPV